MHYENFCILRDTKLNRLQTVKMLVIIIFYCQNLTQCAAIIKSYSLDLNYSQAPFFVIRKVNEEYYIRVTIQDITEKH